MNLTSDFTGHERDDRARWVNMRGRIYDPTTARFLTPDPVVHDPTAPQSWNPYAYVGNNPINSSDPTGLFGMDAPGGGSGGYSLIGAVLGGLVDGILSNGAGATSMPSCPGGCTGTPTPPPNVQISPPSYGPSQPTYVSGGSSQQVKKSLVVDCITVGECFRASARMGFSVHIQLGKDQWGLPVGIKNPWPEGPQLDKKYAESWERYLTANGTELAWDIGLFSVQLGLWEVGGLAMGRVLPWAARGAGNALKWVVPRLPIPGVGAGGFGMAGLGARGFRRIEAGAQAISREPHMWEGFGELSHGGGISADTALETGAQWVGKGYTEVAPGVFRSADGVRQFRMMTEDLVGAHGKIGPHVHFESLNPVGRVIENNHVPLLPEGVSPP